jgi:hypothetical protein
MVCSRVSCPRIQTAEQAELQYKKREKKEAAFGWEIFNQKSLHNAYMKRAEKVCVCLRGGVLELGHPG